jgi:RHS repeat-associated protein
VTRTYAYGLGRISENQQISSTWSPSFYGYDGHGSVRQLTNSAGAVTDTYDYDAFGNLINQTGSTPNNYLFAGEQFDPALGLYYNRARYLNTTTGRFWSMDNYAGDDESPLSLHKYLYTNANPVDGIDPSGNDDLAEVMAGLAISSVLVTMSCSQAPKFVNIVRLAYEEEEYGVHIVLGAQTKGRTPTFSAYEWVQMVTTNALLPAAKKAGAQPDTPFIDPQPHDDGTPYFYTFKDLQAYHTNDLMCGGSPCDFSFEDTPKRYPKFYKDVSGTIYWKASLYFVGLSTAGSSTYTPLVEIDYGFTVAQNGNMTWNDIKIARLF